MKKFLSIHSNRHNKYRDPMFNVKLDKKVYRLSAQFFETSKGLWDFSFILNKTTPEINARAELIDPVYTRKLERKLNERIRKMIEEYQDVFEVLED